MLVPQEAEAEAEDKRTAWEVMVAKFAPTKAHSEVIRYNICLTLKLMVTVL